MIKQPLWCLNTHFLFCRQLCMKTVRQHITDLTLSAPCYKNGVCSDWAHVWKIRKILENSAVCVEINGDQSPVSIIFVWALSGHHVLKQLNVKLPSGNIWGGECGCWLLLSKKEVYDAILKVSLWLFWLLTGCHGIAHSLHGKCRLVYNQ